MLIWDSGCYEKKNHEFAPYNKYVNGGHTYLDEPVLLF